MQRALHQKKHWEGVENDVTLNDVILPVAIARVPRRLGAKYFCVPPTKALRFQSCNIYENNNYGSGAEPQPPEANGRLGADLPRFSGFYFFSKNNHF